MRRKNWNHRFLTSLAVLLLASCTPPEVSPNTDQTGLASQTSTPARSLDWIDIYFTAPQAPLARYHQGGPDEALAAAIDRARLSVDVAIHNLNLWSIRDALLDAWHRGVTVRIVTESDNLEGDEFQALIAAGIPVLGDRREGLMHDKFVIIDRQEVWTGSMNFTLSGAYYENNNLVCLRSAEVAQAYLQEFNEMFEADRFGPDSLADTLHPVLTIGGTEVEILFSPDDGVAARLVELVEGAQESIHFLIFSFTADEIARVIRRKAADDVTVMGVMDAGQILSNEGTEYDGFVLAGLDVRPDGNDSQMHHKFIIIDESIVVTGSYNLSTSAETRNDENVLIIHNPDVAEFFLEEFNLVYDQSLP